VQGNGNVKLTIKTPAAKHVANIGAGSLSFSNIEGGISAKLGSGNVKLTHVSGKVRLNMGSGNVAGEFAPHKNKDAVQKISITQGSGTFDLKFPEAAKVSWKLKGAPQTTSINSAFENTTDKADYVLSIATGSGKGTLSKINKAN
jgi:DUF4097 and DUF4098 domain-containing protein YvlB